MTQKKNSVRIAVVGAGREGLEILALTLSQKDIHVLALVDPNEKALGFRLKDYGYRFEDSQSFKNRLGIFGDFFILLAIFSDNRMN